MADESNANMEELLRLARNRDDGALGKLLERSRNYLTVLARVNIGSRLQGKADASDVVQETFLKALRDFQEFQGQSRAEWHSWLRRLLATSLAGLIRRYRGTKARDVRLERDLFDELERSSRSLDPNLTASEKSPSEHISHREQTLLLADLLNELRDDYQQVILLAHMEGLAFPDVAQRMGRSVDSVKHLWIRALARLRRAMKGAS